MSDKQTQDPCKVTFLVAKFVCDGFMQDVVEPAECTNVCISRARAPA